MKKLTLLPFLLICFATFSQVAINTTGAPPDASAMLDITSTTSGLLIPWMISTQRTAIPSPANGLLVYDISTKSFWVFKTGTGWVEIVSFNLPFAGSVNSSNAFPNAAFRITNTNNGAGSAGAFVSGSATNTGSALSATTNGTGNAFRAETGSNTGTAIFAHTTGTSLGKAGSFVNDNAANTNATVDIITNATDANANALTVSSSGGGIAGSFNINSPASIASALQASTPGDGYAATFINQKDDASNSGAIRAFTNASTGSGYPNAILSQANGTLGTTGFFYSVNPNNIRPTMVVRNDGGERTLIVAATNTANAANALDVRSSGTADSRALAVLHNGLGTAAGVQATNSLNASNAVDVSDSGTGTALHSIKVNAAGNGAGGVFEKSAPFTDAYSTSPNCDLEVRHANGGTNGMSGLRILNKGANNNAWTLYTTNDSGNLNLYSNGVLKGKIIAATGAYTAVSDARLKTHIATMPSLLATIMKLQPKTYSYTSDARGKMQLGFLAQEVEPLFPQVVYKSLSGKGTESYTMDYSAFGVIAVKAVQEQQKIIETQQSEIDNLKKEMAEIKRVIGKGN